MNKNTRWTTDEINILKELYPTTDTSQISNILGRTCNSITVKAQRLNIKKNQYICNETYFDEINSHDKAYWLGFIAADGYVVNNTNSRNYELGIELSSIDEGHLVKFLNCISSDSIIKRRARKNFDIRGYGTECQTSFIRIYSKHIVESLSQYGIVPNKSYSLSEICVNPIYIWDYIRGYFDGDGTFSYSKVTSTNGNIHTYGRIGFVCHQIEFLKNLMLVFSNFNIFSNIYKDRTYWGLQIRRKDSVLKFLQNIYTPNCICLRRKQDKCIDFYS